MTSTDLILQGYTRYRNALDKAALCELTSAIAKYQQLNNITSIRHADSKIPAIKTFAQSTLITNLASQYITGPPQLVRAIMFDKNHEENRRVGATL